MPEIRKKPVYAALVTRFAWKESREEIRSHVRVTVITIIASSLLGLSGAVPGGLLGSLIGAVGAPTLIGIGLYLWKLINAPASIHRQQEKEIERLQVQIQRNVALEANDKEIAAKQSLVGIAVRISKASIVERRRLDDGRHASNVLALEFHVTVVNRLDQAIAVRPKTVALFQGEREILAEWTPRALMDLRGRICDYSHFPEGQHTTEAHFESEALFGFDAIPPEGGNLFWDRDLDVLLTISVPEAVEPTRTFRLPLPPRIYARF